MTDNLYRSYHLEKSQSDSGIVTSGSLITWENNPVSSLDVGDTFRPVPNGPLLTVKKVSIDDNVIGVVAGKTVRQWQISVEGDNETSQDTQDTQTHVLYNFGINADEHSGTMEITNTGDAPAVTLSIGDLFNVPGVGRITCVNIKGSDSYDDNGNHVWTITYEGSDVPQESSDSDDDAIPETKYNLAIEKDSDGLIQKSGSKVVVSEGSSPAFDIQVGSTFSIPGIGNVTCSKVSGGDDYTASGAHRWTMTYEGYINDSEQGETPSTGSQDTKYHFSVEKNSSGDLTHSGSVEISTITDTPPSAYQVGSTINIPGIGNVTCVKVSGSDSYTENGRRKWVIVYEATDDSESISDPEQQEASVQYSFDIETNSDGVTIYSGTKEISYHGDSPAPGISLGDTFSVPVVGTLICTKVSGSDDGSDNWTFIIEGSRGGNESSGSEGQEDTSLPDSEISLSYELNGVTVRTVDGNFVALRRSETPITKKSIIVYSNSENITAVPGSTYQGGIVVSENVVKETIKQDNVVISTYYKHTIEVEA